MLKDNILKRSIYIAIPVIFVIGIYVGTSGLLSIENIKSSTPIWLKNVLREIQRKVTLAMYGEQLIVATKLNGQYSVSESGRESRLIETSVLPLRLEFIPMSSDGKYPTAAGAITIIEGSLIVMDRLGGFYRYDNSAIAKISTPDLPNNIKRFILESPDVLNSDTLRAHSVAYDPIRRKVFVSYEKYIPKEKAYRFEISVANFEKSSFSIQGEWEIVFSGEVRKTIPGQAGGGKLLIVNDNLYFSVGDFGPYEDAKSQDLSTTFGKIYRYTLSNRNIKMLSYGHRNTQGLVITANGELINVEQGPQGGDELNIIKEGKNYGWPYVTYGTEYGSYKWPLKRSIDSLSPEEPLFSWVPSIAADAIIQIHNFHANWKSDLLVGALKGQSLYRIRYIAGRIVFVEPIWLGHRIRDLIELNGHIYIYTDDSLLIKVVTDDVAYQADSKSSLAGYYQDKFLARCVVCHHFGDTTPTHTAPSLSGLIGRNIGGDANFGIYSSAMKSKKAKWNSKNLAEYLRDPTLFAPGTTMPKLGLSDSEISTVVSKLSK